MNIDQLHALLSNLSGHLLASSPDEENELQSLHSLLSRSLLADDIAQLKATSFAFENADLFSLENIHPARLEMLRSVAEVALAQRAEPEFRMFAREVPVRSPQLHASVPLWGAGAAVERTIGPFTRADGRVFWFDFYRIERLVALYIQNRPNPVLLFNVRSDPRFLDRLLPLVPVAGTSYQLGAGSVWIDSTILAANAPAGDYTGLTIRGGTVSLSAAPHVVNGKLTAAPSTVITVRLRLQQPAVTDADEASPYGVDARDAELELPSVFSFHFTGASHQIDEASEARWNVFGQAAGFEWDRQATPTYDNLIRRVLIPYICSERDFAVNSCRSPLHTLRGRTRISSSAWALPAGPIDVANPTPAAGIGGLLIKGGKGLTNDWQGLKGGELNLVQPHVLAEPGSIGIFDPVASNVFCQQSFKLWKDDLNQHGTTVAVQYPPSTPFWYFTFANGNEAVMIFGHADFQIDRPVTVAARALAIKSKNSLLVLSASKTLRSIALFDDNILIDALDLTKKPPSFPGPIALALHNALFKVTPVNGCVLFGQLAEDFVKVKRGFLYLTFGMFGYLPTLPDPYAARLGFLTRQFITESTRLTDVVSIPRILEWLTCRVVWETTNVPAEDPDNNVAVSFHFAPLQNQFQAIAESDAPAPGTNLPLFSSALAGLTPPSGQIPIPGEVEEGDVAADDKSVPLPNYGAIWDESTGALQQDQFALLDVSTNADLFGVSFGSLGGRRMLGIRTFSAVDQSGQSGPGIVGLPLQVQGMDVVSPGLNVRAFTVPQISWEPVFNLTKPEVAGDPWPGFNYYPDDGGPTRIINASTERVALAPIPLTDFLVETYDREDKFEAVALFTLPFGLRALSLLKKEFTQSGATQAGTNLSFAPKTFPNNLTSVRQLQLDAGESPVVGESNMFAGCTIQVNNVIEMSGAQLGSSTLGRSVTKIFNREFMPTGPGALIRGRGVPVSRIDLSGYGANMFSNWLNPKATIAATSQTKFDVMMGRCAHEIIQVRSIMYPWGVRVVRTITLLRAATNYVFRHDSGWKPESHGKYDFSYYANVLIGGKAVPQPRPSPYEVHPGCVLGIYNVQEIKETRDIAPFTGKLFFAAGETYLDELLGLEHTSTGPGADADAPKDFELQPVYFNADVEIADPISGFVTKVIDGVEKKLVPSKKILGFVQLAPRGMPITKQAFQALLASQMGSIGGPCDCLVNIGNSGQHIRLNRFDINNSVAANNTDPIFAVAGRGNVILPKDGSWSLVKHEHGAGTVSPVPEDLSVPLIRVGKLIKPTGVITTPLFDLLTIQNTTELDGELVLEPGAENNLLRIANPTELLRAPVPATINYGFLHSTDTQKALFLTPSFARNQQTLFSKIPPLFADAFRMVNSKAVFPRIGDAITNYGEAIALIKDKDGLDQFTHNAVTNALELMKINQLQEQGYQLLKKAAEFDLPNTEFDLINIGNSFRIYIEYKAEKVKRGTKEENLEGSLDFDVDSFANNVADKWKSRMKNVALVVDLGPIKKLMTIKGNWDAKKGSEAQFGGGGADEVPQPQIELSPQLQPVMEILDILAKLSGEDYGGAFAKGVKLAMSNKAGAWEYKFEASKEIPVLRFPPGPLYNDPNAPFKLEAGLRLGAYFNAALQIPTDTKQLLPSAGGYLGFYGRLSVMCVSLSVATVYAVGQANLDFGADTKAGPFLRLKFGFGAQLVVGLPVIGNVSVLYMVGVEIYLDKTKVNVSAFLLFQGHAEILGGLVSVTITIEAKGTYSRNVIEEKTYLAAQVTFGLDITVFWVIDISFEESWEETRLIA